MALGSGQGGVVGVGVDAVGSLGPSALLQGTYLAAVLNQPCLRLLLPCFEQGRWLGDGFDEFGPVVAH